MPIILNIYDKCNDHKSIAISSTSDYHLADHETKPAEISILLTPATEHINFLDYLS